MASFFKASQYLLMKEDDESEKEDWIFRYNWKPFDRNHNNDSGIAVLEGQLGRKLQLKIIGLVTLEIQEPFADVHMWSLTYSQTRS